MLEAVGGPSHAFSLVLVYEQACAVDELKVREKVIVLF